MAPDGPALLVAREGDGRVLLLAGGRRLERRGDEVRVAEESSAAPWRWAIRGENRWRFGTDAAAYESESFLGPLREILSGARPCRGVGRACWITPRGELPGVGLPARGAVIDAAFLDERRGAVVLEPGAAYATDDGGATWFAVALDDDVPLATVADASGLWVRGARAATQILPDGTLHPTLAERTPWVALSADPADERAAARAREFDPAGWLYRAALDGYATTDRVLVPGPRQVLAYDPVRETFEPTGPEECVDAAFAPSPAIVLRCAGDNAATVWKSSAGARWEREFLAADPHATCRASENGEHVGCTGGCAPGAASATRVCERSGDSTTRTGSLPLGELLGYDDDGTRWAAVDADGPPGDAPVPLASLRLARGDQWLPPASESSSTPGATVTLRPWPALGEGGTLRLAARASAAGPLGVLEGPAGGTMVFRPAPDRASWVGVSPAGSALAYAQNTGFSQADPSLAFAPLTLGDDGFDEALRDMLAAPPDPALAACGRAGCVFDATRARVGWGPAARSRFSALEAPPVDTPRGREDPAAWRCVRDGFALRVPEPQAWYPSAIASTSVVEGPAGSLLVRERIEPRGGALLVDASWYGRDAREGVSTARARLTQFTQENTRWIVIDLSRERAVLARCGSAPGGVAPGCAVLSLRRGGHGDAAVVAALPAPPAVVARADAALALLTAPSPEASTDTPGEARELLFSTPIASPHATTVAVARDGGAGVFVLDGQSGSSRRLADGTVVLAPAGGATRVIPAGSSGAPCGSFARGEIALPESGTLDLGDQGTREMDLEVRYGVEQGALCRRGLDGTVRQFGEPGWIAAQEASSSAGGALRGTARTRGQITPVRCEPAAGVQR